MTGGKPPRLSDMKEGWIRIYRPQPRGEDKSEDEPPKDTSDKNDSNEQ